MDIPILLLSHWWCKTEGQKAQYQPQGGPTPALDHMEASHLHKLQRTLVSAPSEGTHHQDQEKDSNQESHNRLGCGLGPGLQSL